MNILIFNWRDIKHPLAGGAEISLFEHAKYWEKKGASVTWFASSFPKGKEREDVEGIKIIRKGSHYSVHFLAFLNYLQGRLGNPSIVIDSFHFLPFFTPLYIKKAKIVGLINEVAGRVWFSNIIFPLSLIGYLIESLFFAFYKNTKFITSSDSTRDELIKFGILKEFVNIVHHGVTVKKIKKDIVKEKNPTIIFLGRISEDKGIKDALMAFSELKGKIKNCKLWIAGREENEGYLEGLIKGVGLNKFRSEIIYFDYVSEEKKFELLKKAWVLIHPSRKEGWGLNVIEAASQGTPTVGYNTEGLRDSIVDDKTGLLSDPNPKSLADKAFKLISDKRLYYKLELGAEEWANKFNWEESNRQSWEVIKNI
ncbi:MAG: glycosyltransferase family 4 protein [Candidatus Levybacteria bacterium]|nr:glycosyltransferase family 4 protein [Candidatus Levybacteria bacterium]